MQNNNWVKVVGGIVLVVIVALITVKLAGPSGSVSNSVYDRVISSGVIRACYIVTAPSLIKDPSSKTLSGTSFDILEQAAKNLGLKVSWDYEVGWGEAIESLNTDKCDIVGSAIWGNSNRAKTSEFIEPIYYSAINAYVRAGDDRFDGNLKLANDEKIKLAVEDGSTTYLIAGSQFPKAQTVRLTGTAGPSGLMLEIASGKADMTFLEASQVSLYQKTNPGKLKAVQNVKPVALYDDVMLVKKGEYKLKTTIDGAIRELIYGGFVDKTLDIYEKTHSSVFYRVALPYVIPK
jgi:polar amino acid transport system substrate-binding protein